MSGPDDFATWEEYCDACLDADDEPATEDDDEPDPEPYEWDQIETP